MKLDSVYNYLRNKIIATILLDRLTVKSSN